MTLPTKALLLVSALWLSGCATTTDPVSTPLEEPTLTVVIGEEIERLLTGINAAGPGQVGWVGGDRHTIATGDTVLSVLRKQGVDERIYYDLPQRDQQRLSHLKPGDELLFLESTSGAVIGLGIESHDGWRLASRGDKSYSLRANHPYATPLYQVVDLALKGSLEETLIASNLSLREQAQFAEILSLAFPAESFPSNGWLRLRTEHFIMDGVDMGPPGLVSAALSAGSAPRFVIRYQDSAGAPAYYDALGRRLDPSWLSHPIRGDYRITSNFNPHRKHPVTGRVRPHNGKDFAAASGTPVLAATDGVVTHAGWNGSWGRLIVLEHPNGITTRYAHLSSVEGLEPGQKVKMGELIGRVGSSGLSTGPHLHFEVYANGLPQDPSTFSPGQSSLLAGERLRGGDLATVREISRMETLALGQLPVASTWLAASITDNLTGQGGPDEDDN